MPVLLTFDLEEFDLPADFGCHVAESDLMNVTNNGLERLTGLLDEYCIPATFFTTAFYAERNRESIRQISEKHEIASHSRTHTGFLQSDPLDSRLILEEIIKKPVAGFRMPRFGKQDMTLLKSSGYLYDSSMNPTLIPGRYNNLLAPRKPYIDNTSGLTEFPLSVSPILRFPLFWLSFKNIPFSIYLSLYRQALRKDDYLHLCFHPWEFDDLERFRIPKYVKTISGEILLARLGQLVAELKKTASFVNVSSYLETINRTEQSL